MEVVTREDGEWSTHVVASQTVQANTMTQISIDYSGISNIALQATAQVSVIPVLNLQSSSLDTSQV